MAAHLLRRLAGGLLTLLGVTLVTFVLFHVFGGNPVVAFLGKSASPSEIAALEHQYGFDRPLWAQYLRFLGEIFTADFGKSFVTQEPVIDILARGLGPSLSLTVPALFFGTVIAVTIGLLAARFRGRLLDRGLVLLAVVGMSVSFLTFIVVGQYWFAFVVRWFPIHGYDPGLLDRWPYLALPIGILVIVGLGYDTRYFRAVLVEELQKDHVLVARARGLGEGAVLFRHVLANAAVPIVTRVMISVPFLVTGSLLLESFFGIPGLGGTLLSAIDAADLPVIKAYTVAVSAIFIISNGLTDLFYVALDPRVRLG